MPPHRADGVVAVVPVVGVEEVGGEVDAVVDVVVAVVRNRPARSFVRLLRFVRVVTAMLLFFYIKN